MPLRRASLGQMEHEQARHPLNAVGAKIRILRSAQGYSQEGFARACGLDRTYIGGIERGERNLGVINLVRIARALGVPPAELLADITIGAGDD